MELFLLYVIETLVVFVIPASTPSDSSHSFFPTMNSSLLSFTLLPFALVPFCTDDEA